MSLYRGKKANAGPEHDLDVIQQYVANNQFHPYDKSALSRVIQVFGGDRRQAARKIKEIVATLAPDDFVETVTMGDGSRSDVYGKLLDDLGWYLKLAFNVQDDEVDVQSCHPARYDLTTKGAGVVPGSDEF